MEPLNILIVDDEEKICEFLKDILSDLGHRVFTNTSGEEALDMLEYRQFDLVFLDIRMPYISGREIIRELRSKNNKVKIVVYSGVDDEPSIKHIKSLGADQIITKPGTLKQIEDSVLAVK